MLDIYSHICTFYQSVCNIAKFGSHWSGICLTWAYKIQQTSNRFQCVWTVALSLAPILWMNTWHSPHFNFPINHSHSVNHRLCVHTYTINPCMSISAYISLVLCTFSPFSWQRSTDQNILQYCCQFLCYAKQKSSLKHCSQHSNEQ